MADLSPQSDPGLLTDAEHALIAKLGSCWNEYAKILGDGPSREHDANEFVHHVHVLQQAVMAQAAARAYPHRYRLAGALVGEVPRG